MSNTAKSKTDARLDEVLKLATKTAKSELGANASNKAVEARATLATSVTENGESDNTSVNAGVSLGVSSSKTAATPACPCEAKSLHACCSPAPESK